MVSIKENIIKIMSFKSSGPLLVILSTLDIRYGPLISWPPTNQFTSQVKITLQQSAPNSHEYAELQALQLGNHKNVWSWVYST